MNAKQILVAVVATIAVSSSFAATMTEFSDHRYVSSKSRAEVVAELKQARANGEPVRGEETAYPVLSTSKSVKSRADVLSEIKQSSVNKASIDYAVAM
ncbi:MAG: DUF4148 domain-containing protein [Herminiimonas sp.]|nr:DUF4148 domain-containing protein [Herminiimonas sp.]